MRKKKYQDFDSESVTREYLDRAVAFYRSRESIRAAAKEMSISPMKMRKLLITEGIYDNEMSREIFAFFSSGMSIQEIAKAEAMTVSNVYAYLPYQNVIYNMDEKSVNAKKQKRYRDRVGGPVVDDALIAWLNAHPGIVEGLRKRAGLDVVD